MDRKSATNLGSVIEINPASISKHYPYDEIEYIDISSVDTGFFSGSTRMPLAEAPSRAKRLVEHGDTILATVRPNLRSFLFIKNPPENMVVSTGFAVLHPSNKIDARFLYFTVTDQKFTGYLTANAKGSAYPAVDTETIARAEISFPTLEIQQKIAVILSAYDDLIENNLRRIKILEEMAQSLYREWFVKFRFPGHQKVKMLNSPLGKIPQGWEIRQVDEVIETLGGGTPSTKEPSYWEGGNIDWYSPSDLTASGSMFITGSSKKITQIGLDKSSAKLFPAYSLMMTSRATIGVISINTEKACTNQGFITCIPNDRLSVFHLYFWIKESREKIISVASGATFKEISRGEFREFPIAVPPPPIENIFTETVEPMCRLIENLIKKNHNLVVTRDLLLPKLISGELDVSELDIKTGRNDPSPLVGEGWDGGNG